MLELSTTVVPLFVFLYCTTESYQDACLLEVELVVKKKVFWCRFWGRKCQIKNTFFACFSKVGHAALLATFYINTTWVLILDTFANLLGSLCFGGLTFHAVWQTDITSQGCDTKTLAPSSRLSAFLKSYFPSLI